MLSSWNYFKYMFFDGYKKRYLGSKISGLFIKISSYFLWIKLKSFIRINKEI